MKSNIILNVVEPGDPAPVPIDPGVNSVALNTGLFTHGIGSLETTIIVVSTVVILPILVFGKEHLRVVWGIMDVIGLLLLMTLNTSIVYILATIVLSRVLCSIATRLLGIRFAA